VRREPSNVVPRANITVRLNRREIRPAITIEINESTSDASVTPVATTTLPPHGYWLLWHAACLYGTRASIHDWARTNAWLRLIDWFDG
jgi:hypothetical protein